MERLKESFIFWSVPILFFAAWYLRHILLIIAAALVFGSAIQTWALWLERRFRLPFLLGVFLVYLSLITIVALSIYGLFPILRQELASLLPNLEALFDGLHVRQDSLVSQLLNSFDNVFSNVGPFLFGVLGGIFSAGLILILSFYFTTHRDLYRHAIAFLPSRSRDRVEQIWLSARRKFAAWMAAQLLLMLIIALAAYVLMTVFGIPNAILIATIAGLTEIVPILGPVIAASIALLITLATNPSVIWWILLGFVIIQEAENKILVPVMMKKALAINPVFTIIAIMVGGAVGGILGVMTVLPIVLFGVEVYKSLTVVPEINCNPEKPE